MFIISYIAAYMYLVMQYARGWLIPFQHRNLQSLPCGTIKVLKSKLIVWCVMPLFVLMMVCQQILAYYEKIILRAISIKQIKSVVWYFSSFRAGYFTVVDHEIGQLITQAVLFPVSKLSNKILHKTICTVFEGIENSAANTNAIQCNKIFNCNKPQKHFKRSSTIALIPIALTCISYLIVHGKKNYIRLPNFS